MTELHVSELERTHDRVEGRHLITVVRAKFETRIASSVHI